MEVRLLNVHYVERRLCSLQGETGVTGTDEEVFSWHRRKLPDNESAKNEEAGWSQPSLGTFPSPPLITATNLGFFGKKRSCNLKHAKQSLTFNKHFLYCHKQHPFAVVIDFRTRYFSDSGCCGHSLSRWAIPASLICCKNQKHKPAPSQSDLLEAFLFPSFLSKCTKLYLNVTQRKFRKAKDHTL